MIVALLLLFVVTLTEAQKVTLKGVVTDGADGEPLPFAAVVLQVGKQQFRGVSTDADGRFKIPETPVGEYILHSEYLGYGIEERRLVLRRDTLVSIKLQKTEQALAEVTVTATEKESTTATSVIGGTAMEHLQPSSFSDLMALLPGGTTTPPKTNEANSIKLREVGTTNSDYDVSSLGTKFEMDGAAIGTDANMQAMPDASSSDADADRSSVGKGVDLRTIPTDNIEKVEIIRGIPSVKYGDVSSGVVKIERKSGAMPMTCRLKVDQYGRLVSIGKGIATSSGWTVNGDAGLMKSHADPRDKMSTYSRVNASVRTRKTYRTGKYSSLNVTATADYSGNIDKVKSDPEMQLNEEDSYRSEYHKGSLSGAVNYKGDSLSLGLSYSVSLSGDEMRQTKKVILTRDSYTPTLDEAGVHDAEVLPSQYVATYRVSGRPFYSNLKVNGDKTFKTGIVSHTSSVGLEWQYNKNYGRGQIYDAKRPLHGSTTHRPRRFRDIPSTSILGVYAEDEMSVEMGKGSLSLQIGARGTMMTNLSEQYQMSGKMYIDPRGSLKYTLKSGKNRYYVSLGVGRMSKMPTIVQLNPDKVYTDLQELNYWSANQEERRVILKTFVFERDAYDLEPAHNTKYEVRIGGSVGLHTLSLTAFKEKMDDGFRSVSTPRRMDYDKYELREGVKVEGYPSDLGVFTKRADTILTTIATTGNGSLIDKKGVEWQYSSPRIKGANLRLSVVGAWLKTKYSNSIPEWYAGVGKVILGKVVNERYIGLYAWDYGSVRTKATTSVTTDCYVDKIGFILSVTAEIMMYGEQKSPLRNASPTHYYDTQGEVHEYTEESKKDPMLAALRLSNTQTDVTTRERAYGNFHFKVTKQFGTYATVSLFADRLLNAARDYKENGFTVRRVFTPYFGIQMNLKI
ncbi:MAG: TonB-dependent receptor [Bacteroidales bacterium]|nr:TonB-dependent receptor [Bacteroidales bacterium]